MYGTKNESVMRCFIVIMHTCFATFVSVYVFRRSVTITFCQAHYGKVPNTTNEQQQQQQRNYKTILRVSLRCSQNIYRLSRTFWSKT